MAKHTRSNGMVRWKNFGREIKTTRGYGNEGLREFARRTRIDKATVCRAEQGKVVSVGNYFALCVACALDPWDYIKERQ